ncbi:thiol oxidoreductase, partial [bacterium]|nr:thiol oxidoreductase [bacterium]
RDGLGPTYNAISCASCHTLDGRGVGYYNYTDFKEFEVDVSLLFRLSQTDHYGGQLNPLGIGGVPGEAQAKVILKFINGTYAYGSTYQVREPKFVFSDFSYGPFPENAQISPRVAPQMIGLGLIEAIDEKSILKNEDPQDLNQDGISGRANYITDVETNQPKLGRFGWKASQPSLKQQNAAAFLGDLGMTTSLFSEETCPPVQILCLQAPNGGTPEINDDILKKLTIYTQTLGVPQRRNTDQNSVINGEKIFLQIRCDSCHTPSFQTGSTHEIPFLHNQLIYPYSDFLLHDMGYDLADHRPDGKASGREWRTQPLWGIGLIPTVNGHQNLLHDARARNVEEAILWHGGEAEASREAFKMLSKTNRQYLIDFINSL